MHATRLIACLGAFALGAAVPGFSAGGAAATTSGERTGMPEGRSTRGPEGRRASVADRPIAGLTEPSEFNAWPALVRQTDDEPKTETTALGPFLFSRTAADGSKVEGLRPLWIQQEDDHGKFRAGFFVYPLFSYRVDENTYQWNVFELIRNTGRRGGAPAPRSQFEPRGDFEVWPFIFWRQTGDPALSYAGVFPIGGTVKDKFGFDRATWVLFPLYTRSEKRAVVTTSVPWPFVRVTSGAAHGFGLWPLFDWVDRPGAWKHHYFLWPLGYDNTTYPSAEAPVGTAPTRDIGALPLYARRTAPGYIDENFLWPFFGYTDRTLPNRFHETRYFWPFLVQGRGDDRYINRWGPFYTHSIVQGYDKTWYGWPLVRHAEWTDRGLAISKTQLLYFIYWSERQRHVTRPNGPAASLTHVWPLYSAWDSGAGQRQFQLFSPLEVFFPGNEKIRDTWTPFFALARQVQSAPGTSRTSLLWNAVTWTRDDAHQARAFHFGPIFSVAHRAAAEEIRLGSGLVTFERKENGAWSTRWFDFGRRRVVARSNGPAVALDPLTRATNRPGYRPANRQALAATQTSPR